jgi:hypothetical protein
MKKKCETCMFGGHRHPVQMDGTIRCDYWGCIRNANSPDCGRWTKPPQSPKK